MVNPVSFAAALSLLVMI